MFHCIHLIRSATLAGIAAIGLAACQSATDTSTRLSADEVRSTFVGRPWSGTYGKFNFDTNGTYRYADSKISVHGTYSIANDGVLCAVNADDSQVPGRKTCFTFYKEGSGYKYYHDRSGKFWPVHLK